MLEEVYFGNTVLQYLKVLVVLLASAIVAKLLFKVFKTTARAVTAKTKSKLDDVLLDLAEEPVVAFVVILGSFWAVGWLTLPEGIVSLLDKAFFIAVAVNFTWLLLRSSHAFVQYVLKPLTDKTESKMDDQLIPIADKALKLIIIVLALIVIMSNFGFDVSALIAGLGIGGLAIALATKEYLENIVGGLTIFTDKPFRLGDRIKIDGVQGTIKEVGIRSTRIMTFDNTLVTIPNSKMVNSVITNVSAPDKTIAVKMNIGLVYDTSVSKMRTAKKIIDKAIVTTAGVAENKKPMVYFTEFGDSALKLWVKYFIDNHGDALHIKDVIHFKIKSDFEKEKIDMAYPTQTIYTKKE